MTQIEPAQLESTRGGLKHTFHKGWTEEVKHSHGAMYYRRVSPSGRKGRWNIVDTYWANDP